MRNVNVNEIETGAVAPAGQLEMNLAGRRLRPSPAATSRQRRAQRAQWWFRQMRRVVDRAMDWDARPARPEQKYLTLAAERN